MEKTTITITGEVETAKLPQAKACFLKKHPIPTDAEGNDIYTFLQWLKICMWQYVCGEIKQGKKRLDAEVAELDDIIK